MKKLLFLLLATVALCGCESKKDSPACPVTGITVPKSSPATPIKPNDVVTIKGSGFTPDCRIFLRGEAVQVRAAVQTETEAEIIEVTTTSLSFRAPKVYGEQSIVLVQDGNRWTIGELVFQAQEISSTDPLPRRVSRIRVSIQGDMKYTMHFTYDSQNRITEIRETDRYNNYPGADTTKQNDVVTRITYGTNRVTLTKEYDSCSFDLENGRAKSGGWPDSGSFSFSYDSDGYIAKTIWQDSSDRDECVFTVSDGNLSGYVLTYYESGKVDEIETYAFTNDSGLPNNLNLDLYGIEAFEAWDLDVCSLLGIAGNRFRTLPSKISLKENGRETASTTYRYTMDGDYISRIDIRHEEKDEDWVDSSILEIFYEE